MRRGRLTSCTLVVCGMAGVIAACTRGGERPDTLRTTMADTQPPPVLGWRVDERGVGPLHAGTSLAGMDSLLGLQTDSSRLNRECDYVWAPANGDTLLIMIVGGRVARVDITRPGLTTTEGIGVGDRDSLVLARYAGRVRRSPHKYVEGQYLTVTPAAGSAHRLVFEVEGGKVTRYRAGRMPEVEWVERCG